MRIVVREWERVLRYRDGRFVELLEPGMHRRSRWRTRTVLVDLRPGPELRFLRSWGTLLW